MSKKTWTSVCAVSVLVSVLSCVVVVGQSVRYEYDLAGNSTQKIVVGKDKRTVYTYKLGLGNRLKSIQKMVEYKYDTSLYRIRDHEGAGFIDKNGKVVIEPVFSWCEKFHENLAVVWKDGKCGFIDGRGKIIVPLKYENAEDYSEDRAWVKYQGRWVLLDETGTQLSTNSFDETKSFSNGGAAVRRGSKWGFVNNRGKIIVSPQFLDAGWFGGILAPVRTEEGYGYISASGKVVIPCSFQFAGTFKDGLALATTKSGRGYINEKGVFVIPPNYCSGSCRVSPDLIALWTSPDDQQDYYNLNGDIVFSIERGTGSSEFSEGYARVYVPGKRLIIDLSGKVVASIDFTFDTSVCSEGLLAVREESPEGIRRSGFMNMQGNIAIPLMYDAASSFEHGLALFTRGLDIILRRLSNTPMFGLKVGGLCILTAMGMWCGRHVKSRQYG